MDEPLLFMVLLVPLLALAAFVMEWTLAPLISAARNRATERRFLLTDLLWLVVQLQLVMALVACAYPPNSTDTSRVWGLVALGLSVIAFWFASLQAVSQAGIMRPMRRAAVFVVVLPGAIAAIIGMPALLGALIVSGLRTVLASTGGTADLGLLALQVAFGLAAMLVVRSVASWTVGDQTP
jgi:hypothetical protein